MTSVILLSAFVSAAPALQDKPIALVKMEQHRAAIETARIEWSVERAVKDGASAAQKQLARERFFTTRLAPDEILAVGRGDSKGLRQRDADGKATTLNQAPVRFLLRDEQIWRCQEEDIQAQVYQVGRMAQPDDLRSLGVFPWREPRSIAAALDLEARYESAKEGGLEVVTATMEHGVMKWWLDPARGWSAVRSAWYDDEGLLYEARCSLSKHGDQWFPKAVTYFSRKYKGGKEPFSFVRVHAAEFNAPNQPSKFTFEALGIEVGFNVQVFDDQLRPARSGKFDGQRVISLDEYYDRVNSGELQEGPRFHRVVARVKAQRRERSGEAGAVLGPLPADSKLDARAGAGRKLSAWEAYTQQFIDRYQLDEQQTQKAWTIYRECRAHAEKITLNDVNQTGKLRKRIADSGDAATGETEALRKQVSVLAERVAKNVRSVFEQRLTPRLERIPTRAQRKAGDADSEKSRVRKQGKP